MLLYYNPPKKIGIIIIINCHLHHKMLSTRKHVRLAMQMLEKTKIEAFSPFNLYYALMILVQLCDDGGPKRAALCAALNITPTDDAEKLAASLNAQTGKQIELLMLMNPMLGASERTKRLADKFRFQIASDETIAGCILRSTFIMDEIWRVPFDKSHDTRVNFAGHGVITAMKQQFDDSKTATFAVSDKAASFKLACESSREFCVVVPFGADIGPADALHQIEQHHGCTSKFSHLNVFMPGFDIETKNIYKSLFTAMGMGSLFEVEPGDLDVFASEPGKVIDIHQKTKVSVGHTGVYVIDEVDIEMGGAGGMYESPRKAIRTTTTIVCNRAFFWAIVDPKYNNLYAFGKYTEPEAYLDAKPVPLVDTLTITKEEVTIGDDW